MLPRYFSKLHITLISIKAHMEITAILLSDLFHPRFFINYAGVSISPLKHIRGPNGPRMDSTGCV